MSEGRKFQHYKPYEIRLEDSDPVSAYDNPAGAIAAFSRSKYKLWINTSNLTYFVRANKRYNKWTGPFNIGSGSIQDLANGKVLIDLGLGGQQEAVRPTLELSLLSGPLDISNDRICLYDQSTNTYVYVTPNILSQPEVFRNNGPLSGPVPAGYTVGVDYSTGTQYYKNASNNRQAFPAGTTVVLTDLASGIVSINAGLGGTQEAIRPITELVDIVGDIAPALDRIVIRDQSTGTHTKVAPQYLQNWMKQGNATTQTTGISNVATGVNNLGIISPVNAIGSFDNRSSNYQPQQYAPGAYWEFKEAAVIGIAGIGLYAGLYTFRAYGFATDLSGGQLRQEAHSNDGTRKFWRVSTSATTWSVWTEMPSGLSSAIPLADGLNNTRTGQVGVSPLSARQDHIHPITKLTAFAVAPTLTFGGFTTPTTTPVAMTYAYSTEETITYRWTGTLTVPNVAARKNFTSSGVAGFSQRNRFFGAYRTTNWIGYPNGPCMENEANDNYANSNTTYLYNNAAPGAVQTLNNVVIEVTYTLN